MALAFVPVGAAQPVQRGRVAAGVVADGVDLVGRHVELVVAPVLEQQVVALGAADGPLDHAAVAGDPVLVVHDVGRPARRSSKKPCARALARRVARGGTDDGR